jgi:hypothetical protein
MAHARATFDYPDRKPDEPDLTAKQRAFLDHLLEELDARNVPAEQLDGLGKWQASALIDRLIQIRDGVPDDRVKLEPTPTNGEQRRTSNTILWLIAAAIVLVILLGLLLKT